MKKILIALCWLLAVAGLVAKDDTPQERYVKKYADMAVREMIRENRPVQVSCQFCDADYSFTPEALNALLERKRNMEKIKNGY